MQNLVIDRSPVRRRNDAYVWFRQVFSFEGKNYLVELGFDVVHDPERKGRPKLVQVQDLTMTEK